LILRIANGGVNMPAFAQNLKPGEMNDLITFLKSRTAKRPETAGRAP
jgi:hypothetical protein